MSSEQPDPIAAQALSRLAAAEDRLAPVEHHRLGKRAEFVDMTIEGERFKGCIYSRSLILRARGGAVCALGSASIVPTGPAPVRWAIYCRGDCQRIALHLSDAGRLRLALEFGLPIDDGVSDDGDPRPSEAAFFYASRAYAALVQWRRRHPLSLRGIGGDAYLGDWLARATRDARHAQATGHSTC